MYLDKTIATVVPSFNEGTQIKKVIDSTPSLVDFIIIIDDCSSDDTSEVVKAEAQKNSKVVLIRHSVNQGVGGAIASGYKYCAEKRIDIAVVMAGDAQMDPNDLPAIIDPVAKGEADYTKGNRLFYKNAFKMIPKVRFFGNSALSFLTKAASGYWHIFDSQTGYTAINLRALDTIEWDEMYKRYGQPNDLLTRLNVYNFRVRDVPIRPVYNVGEKSKLKVRKAIFSIGWLLVKLFFWRMKEKYLKRDFHPLVLFYFLGALSLVSSTVFLGRVLYFWRLHGSVPEISLISFLFCIGFGLQAVFFGMWLDMDYNKHLR
jgi:glycosyltransferase involved in cell wall biosynthesis